MKKRQNMIIFSCIKAFFIWQVMYIQILTTCFKIIQYQNQQYKHQNQPSSVSQALKNGFYILFNLGEGLCKVGFSLFKKIDINYLEKQANKIYFLFTGLFSIIGNLLACKDIFYCFLCQKSSYFNKIFCRTSKVFLLERSRPLCYDILEIGSFCLFLMLTPKYNVQVSHFASLLVQIFNLCDSQSCFQDQSANIFLQAPFIRIMSCYACLCFYYESFLQICLISVTKLPISAIRTMCQALSHYFLHSFDKQLLMFCHQLFDFLLKTSLKFFFRSSSQNNLKKTKTQIINSIYSFLMKNQDSQILKNKNLNNLLRSIFLTLFLWMLIILIQKLAFLLLISTFYFRKKAEKYTYFIE